MDSILFSFYPGKIYFYFPRFLFPRIFITPEVGRKNSVFARQRDKVGLNFRGSPGKGEYNSVWVRGYSIYPDDQQGQVCAVRCKLGQQYVIRFSRPLPLVVGPKEPPARSFIYNAGSAREAAISRTIHS